MRGKSHSCMGKYLLDHYMPGLPGVYEKAFLLGCIEPDRNPATYLKGSIRYQWLRGHNYRNAHRFMHRISLRLERRRQKLNLHDYYTLGKLIHYITDAFTYAHNASFPASLSEHREYETALQNYFLSYIQDHPKVSPKAIPSIMDAVSHYHKKYETRDAGVRNDSHFALTACCCAMAVLFVKSIP